MTVSDTTTLSNGHRRVLVTGGTGYIGSHACVELMSHGYDVVIADNLENSRRNVVDAIARICGRAPDFHRVDVRNRKAVTTLLKRYSIDAVLHFAGLKAVGESVAKPLEYYETNLCGTLCLLRCMQEAGITKLVFSSSATVYGQPRRVPIPETHPLDPISPYGRSKLAVEQVLADFTASRPDWSIAVLRYFNPAGAHGSGLIGEDPLGVPNNLMPYLGRVFTGDAPYLEVFGNDYGTPDGTGIRDYIHVCDLAEAHLKALEALEEEKGIRIANIGTGRGYSVLEIVKAYERACGRQLRFRYGPRRPGDVETCYADPTQAQQWLRWRAKRQLDDICADACRYLRRYRTGLELRLSGSRAGRIAVSGIPARENFASEPEPG